MNEFLNPKSMSTPGAAGALIMLITNTLCYNFPEFSGRYVALVLSFLFGAIVFTASAMKIWERGIYWIVNSLIIFSMGFGTNNIAVNVTEKQVSYEQTGAEDSSVASAVMSFFVVNAFAQNNNSELANTQDPTNPTPDIPAATQPSTLSEAELQAKVKALQRQISDLQAVNQRLRQQQEQSSQPHPASKPVAASNAEKQVDRDVFFKKW